VCILCNRKNPCAIVCLDEAPPPTPLLASVEDKYISQTSYSPPVVTCGTTGAVVALSVEGAVMHILRSLEVNFQEFLYALFFHETFSILWAEFAKQTRYCFGGAVDFGMGAQRKLLRTKWYSERYFINQALIQHASQYVSFKYKFNCLYSNGEFLN